MVDLSPTNDAVKTRADGLEVRLKRIVALAAALTELACFLPQCTESDTVQSVVAMMEEAAPAALQDVEWLIKSFSDRSSQLDAILLKSVA